MDQAKKVFLPVLQGVKLSQTQCPTIAEDRDKMKVIPYALAIHYKKDTSVTFWAEQKNYVMLMALL